VTIRAGGRHEQPLFADELPPLDRDWHREHDLNVRGARADLRFKGGSVRPLPHPGEAALPRGQLLVFGDRRRIQTLDLRTRIRALYPLSYATALSAGFEPACIRLEGGGLSIRATRAWGRLVRVAGHDPAASASQARRSAY
jgi:hypothetical protein